MVVVAAVGSFRTRDKGHAVEWGMLYDIGNLAALVFKRRHDVMNNHERLLSLHNSWFGNRDNELAPLFPVLFEISHNFVSKVPCQKQGVIWAALDKCRIG